MYTPIQPRENSTLLSSGCRRCSTPVMDKFWSIFTMPLGVALCFGPAVIVWWLTRDKAPLDDKSDSH